jgi:parallel beta-helix repeat protein
MVFNNKKHGILLDNCNFTEIRSNALYGNNITGIFVNNSLYNNITTNIVDYHDYPIFLHSSNYTFVINNTGYGNKNDIKELDCDDTNYFEGNNFKKIIGTREEGDDNNNTNKDTIIIDFTLILLICVVVFYFALLTKLININTKNIRSKIAKQ